MLASTLKRLMAALLVSFTILVLSLWAYSPALAVLAPTILGMGFPLTLAIQCVAAANANREVEVPNASIPQLVHSWLRETWVAAAVFLWWQPFRSDRYADSMPGNATDIAKRGVVLVHGFVCNRGVWNAWYPTLAAKGIPYKAINLEPIFASIEAYAVLLDDAVRDMQASTGQPPLVVCHSMGGIVARAWLRSENADARVHRIVTIGSPHHGTIVGNWAPQLPSIANAHQMRFDSPWLETLAHQESPHRRSKFVCFHSNCDNIVFPATSATLAGADNRHIGGLPHLAMALDDSIMEQTLALL